MLRNPSLLFCVVVLRPGISSFTPETYYLDQECTKSLDFDKALILKFTENTTEYDPGELLCNVVIQSKTLHTRLLITPVNLDITVTTNCHENALVIRDSEGQPLNHPSSICGDHLSSDTLNTTGGYAWFEYSKSAEVDNPGTFEILITAFTVSKNGTCPTGNFHCSNDNCIAKDLECNDYNDCGDDSDEGGACHFSVLDIVFLSVGGALFVVIMVTASIVVIVRARRRRGYESVQE